MKARISCIITALEQRRLHVGRTKIAFGSLFSYFFLFLFPRRRLIRRIAGTRHMAEQNLILSAGAAQALSVVAARVLKRPRPVLSANDEVKEADRRRAEEVRREREAKRVRLAFEANARVVPDAATDVARERALRATATRGAVALFNAVASAQRGSSKEKPVDKEAFMGMLKRGVTNMEEEDEDEEVKADWLKDDYLTKNSRKLKDFDASAKKDDSSEDEVEHEFENEQFDDEAEFEDGEESEGDNDDDGDEGEFEEEEIEEESEDDDEE